MSCRKLLSTLCRLGLTALLIFSCFQGGYMTALYKDVWLALEKKTLKRFESVLMTFSGTARMGIHFCSFFCIFLCHCAHCTDKCVFDKWDVGSSVCRTLGWGAEGSWIKPQLWTHFNKIWYQGAVPGCPRWTLEQDMEPPSTQIGPCNLTTHPWLYLPSPWSSTLPLITQWEVDDVIFG